MVTDLLYSTSLYSCVSVVVLRLCFSYLSIIVVGNQRRVLDWEREPALSIRDIVGLTASRLLLFCVSVQQWTYCFSPYVMLVQLNKK